MAGLVTMTHDECWRLLGEDGVGRVGFDRGRGPRIHPINYTVAGGALFVRTTEESEFGAFVAMFAGGAPVAFQADRLEPDADEQWSVLVEARVSRVEDRDAAALLPAHYPEPAPDGPRPVLVRLDPVEVTGRRLVESPGDGSDVPGRAASTAGPRFVPSYWHG